MQVLKVKISFVKSYERNALGVLYFLLYLVINLDSLHYKFFLHDEGVKSQKMFALTAHTVPYFPYFFIVQWKTRDFLSFNCLSIT